MNQHPPASADEPPLEIRVVHAALGIPASYARLRGLPFQPEVGADKLVSAGPTVEPDRPVMLFRPVAVAWAELVSAAKADGATLQLVSGFRSVERQSELIRRKLREGCPMSRILRIMAAPGFSEHHTGCAVDLGTPGQVSLEECFEETAAFRWLALHGKRFGFRLSYPRTNTLGMVYEPWHWRWAI